MANDPRSGSFSDNIDWQAIRQSYENWGFTDSQLAGQFNIPRSTIWSRRNREGWEDPRQEPVTTTTPKAYLTSGLDDAPEQPRYDAPCPTQPPGFYDSNAKKFFDWIGKTKDFTTSRDGSSNTENTLVISDVHIPFHSEDKLRYAVESFLEEHGDGNLCIAGDFMDGYSLNAYGKFKEVSLKHEMAVARQWLEYFSSVFNKVWLIKDNHLHGRIMRQVFKNLAPDLHDLVRHPYDVICEGLPNVEHVQRKYANGMSAGWFVTIGDAFICHAETHSAIMMRPVNNVSQWVDTWSKPLGLPEIRCIMEAHVHKGNEGVLPGRDRKLIETGCLVDWQGVDYSIGPDLKYKPIVQGCVWLSQKNGRTDFNKTRFVYLGD